MLIVFRIIQCSNAYLFSDIFPFRQHKEILNNSFLYILSTQMVDKYNAV